MFGPIGQVQVDGLARGGLQARLQRRGRDREVFAIERDVKGSKAAARMAFPVSAIAPLGSAPRRTATASNAAFGSIAGVTVNDTVGAEPLACSSCCHITRCAPPTRECRRSETAIG